MRSTVAPALSALAKTASASLTPRCSFTGEPPSVSGVSAPKSGKASDSISRPPLTVGLGNDYLYGDSGAGNLGADVFVVTLGAQTDTVLDFASGADRLDVHNTGFTTFAQVQAVASASGASTIINFGAGNKMVLHNFALGNLDASDIIF